MAKGRKRKPDEHKVIQGTFRNDRANKNQPKPSEAPPRAPETCSIRQAEYVDRITSRLEAEMRSSSSHTEVIWLAARRLAEIEELDNLIAAHGRVYETTGKSGDKLLKANPAVSQKNEAERHLHSLLSELGLTPASMGKVSVGKQDKPANPFAQFDRK